MSQYTLISKYGKRMRQLKFKEELKKFPSRNNGGRRKSLQTGKSKTMQVETIYAFKIICTL